MYLSGAVTFWLFSFLAPSLQAKQAVTFLCMFFHVFLEESFKGFGFVAIEIQTD